MRNAAFNATSVFPSIQALESRCLLSAAMPGPLMFPLSAAPSAPLGESVRPYLSVQPFVSGDSPQGYTPDQIRRAYALDSIGFGGIAGTGAGQTIAIVTAYHAPRVASDLAVFSSTFGLPQMNVPGGPILKVVKPAGRVPADPGWGIEAALDVEWAHAIAPRANIILVEARSAQLYAMLSAVRAAAVTPRVSVVTMSWGGSEFSNEVRFDAFFSTPMRHTGVTFVAASGDSGAPASWPAVSANVLAIGGTQLSIDPQGGYSGEIGWDGSGGGDSSYVPQPSYQANVDSSPFRSTPDVSYNSDPNSGIPIYSSANYYGRSGWFQVGGTSAAAPQWAGIIALANEGRARSGLKPLDGPSQVLPALYQMPADNFHDVTGGSSSGNPVQTAGPGYDHVTGLGTPVGDRIVNDLLQPTSYEPRGIIKRKPPRKAPTKKPAARRQVIAQHATPVFSRMPITEAVTN